MTSKNNSFSQQTEAYQKQIKDLQAKNEAQKLDILSRNNDLDTQSKDLRKKLSDYEVKKILSPFLIMKICRSQFQFIKKRLRSRIKI